MGFSKSNMAGWGPKFKDHPKMAFVPVIYHIGPYENACKIEKVEKVPPLVERAKDCGPSLQVHD